MPAKGRGGTSSRTSPHSEIGETVTKLTPRQDEVLQGVTRAGGIALHLQSGRTQTVVRNLIKKGLLTIATDGRVVVRQSGRGVPPC